MGKVLGCIIALIGLAILVAGASVILKPKASVESWAYGEFAEEVPWITFLTENPHEGDILATIGSYVVGVHHSIGIWDVTEANSMDDAESTAQMAGLVTAGFGVLLLIIGAIASGGGEKTVVVRESSKEE